MAKIYTSIRKGSGEISTCERDMYETKGMGCRYGKHHRSLLAQMRAELLKAFPVLLNLPVPRESVSRAINARCIFSCFQIKRQMVPGTLPAVPKHVICYAEVDLICTNEGLVFCKQELDSVFALEGRLC